MSVRRYTQFICTRCGSVTERAGAPSPYPLGWRRLEVRYLDGRDHRERTDDLCPECVRSFLTWAGDR